MEELVFYKQEDILISSTRLSISDKVITMHSVSSIAIDKKEVLFPKGLLISSIFCLLIWFFRPDSEIGVVGLFIGLTLLLVGGITWFFQESSKKEAIVITLTSGEREYIDNLEFDDIIKVFNAINEAIVFRG
jgi:hypothetical protein